METKEERPIFFKVFLFVMLVLFIDAGFFIYANRSLIELNKGVTGDSIKTLVSESYGGLSSFSKIFLIVQWLFLFGLLLISILKDRAMAYQDIGDGPIYLPKIEQETDLDRLYELLKDKKSLSISVISKTFNVDKNVAMEWGKILESGELVSIEYPVFGDPIIKISEENIIKLEENKPEPDIIIQKVSETSRETISQREIEEYPKEKSEEKLKKIKTEKQLKKR